ncbi:FxsA family protein [Peptococcaceae bacterium 1198_IL3148]
MIGRLLLLFLFIPFIELMVIIKVGHWIGLWPTLTLLIAMGLLGFILLRSQGLTVINKIKSDLSRGVPPGQGLMEGFLILVGGIFLIIPGLISDLMGLICVFPPTRNRIGNLLFPWLINKFFNNSRWYIHRWK